MAPRLAQRPRTDRAFERLYRKHVGDVYRYSLAVLRNPADAEDVTQTTFLNAYRAFQRGERPDVAQNWLIKIAHNVCRQRFRTSTRRPQEVEFDEQVTASPEAEAEGPSAEDIRRGLGQLAFNQRAALVARELEGRSYAEIGEILGLSVSAVETLIFRARRALREQLEGSLTCHEAELAVSRQLDGRLPRTERGALRAHLRQCGECATFARRLRAQRTALKALSAVPIPGSLASFFGGTSVGSGVLALKAGAVAATFLAAGGATAVGTHHTPWHQRGKVAVVARAHSQPAAPRVTGQPLASSSAVARPLGPPAPATVPPRKRRRPRVAPTPAATPAAATATTDSSSKKSKDKSDKSNSGSRGRSHDNESGGNDNRSPAERKAGDSDEGPGNSGGGSGHGGGGSKGGGDESSDKRGSDNGKDEGGGDDDLPNLDVPKPPIELPKKVKD
jgi:RNA polymerase sigma-70 factor (ECF subfamily)